MLPGGWEMQGDSSFYQWQCVGLACWFPSQFPASSEGWAGDRQQPPPLLLTTNTLSSTPLCFVFQLTGQREGGGVQDHKHRRTHSPGVLPVSPLSVLLCFPFPSLFHCPQPLHDKGQLFQGDNSHSSLTTASRDNVLVMKNRSLSYIHISHVIEARNHSVESTLSEQ